MQSCQWKEDALRLKTFPESSDTSTELSLSCLQQPSRGHGKLKNIVLVTDFIQQGVVDHNKIYIIKI